MVFALLLIWTPPGFSNSNHHENHRHDDQRHNHNHKSPLITYATIGEMDGMKFIDINGKRLHRRDKYPKVTLGGMIRLEVVEMDSEGKQIIVKGLPDDLMDGNHLLKLKNKWGETTFVLTVGSLGSAGPEGPPGLQGEPGPQGDQGVQGEPGLPGQQGDPGPQGPFGPVGQRGAEGPPGPQGIQGQQGIPGPPGPSGSSGVTGYETVFGPAQNVGAGAFATSIAVCPIGKVAISGGLESGTGFLRIQRSRPDTISSWVVRVKNDATAARTFSAVAVCVDLNN